MGLRGHVYLGPLEQPISYPRPRSGHLDVKIVRGPITTTTTRYLARLLVPLSFTTLTSLLYHLSVIGISDLLGRLYNFPV